MTKSVNDDVLDAALDEIRDNVTRMTLCAGAPASFADANDAGTNHLASVTMAAGDFTKAEGDAPGGGRKLTVAAKSDISIDTGGTANHVALLDVANTRLVYVNEIENPQAVVAENTANTQAWPIQINDPE